MDDSILHLGRGQPSPSLLAADAIRAAVAALSEDRMSAALAYGANGGPMDLRQALAEFLSERYRTPVAARELALGGSISLALALVCQLFTRTGDVVVCEDPTYFHAHSIFATAGVELRGIPIDADGLRVDLLERALAEDELRPALVYCIPSFHNPTAVTLAPARARRLVELADVYDFLIVADEPYPLLHFDPAPPPCMMSYDRGRARVLALGSLSKLLAPGLRTGWVHAHPSLIERFVGHGSIVSGGGLNPFTGAILHRLLDRGALGDHVDHLRAVYSRRAQALGEAVRGALPECHFRSPRGGYFLWLALAPGSDSTALFERARAHGVLFTPGPRCAVSRDLRGFVRLSFAYYDEGDLGRGVERLAQLLRP
ncbi:PLP-dependent aminotransferase family protein [Haliangium sp.]|uniref:aminotransferase-like domain-containing protein n=1 Tax=Haliangium sp. TaxID=2663208 RepID=UPI003D0DAC51